MMPQYFYHFYGEVLWHQTLNAGSEKILFPTSIDLDFHACVSTIVLEEAGVIHAF